jgi:hypothetical protein
MYSKSHDSPEAFERENPLIRRQLLAVDSRGHTIDVSTCASRLGEPQLADLSKFDPSAPLPATAALSQCDPPGVRPDKYLVVEDRCGFDWNAGHFYCTYEDKVIGALQVGN